MSLLVSVLTLLLLAVVIAMISAPLRTARREREPRSEPARRELLAAREAKYREIRDAELDYRTGKLSREDFEAVDGALRVEAVEILERLDSPAEANRLDDDEDGKLSPGLLEQDDRVHYEQDREEDRPAV